MSMANTDGMMAKTDKITPFDILESKVEDHGKPKAVKAYIIY